MNTHRRREVLIALLDDLAIAGFIALAIVYTLYKVRVIGFVSSVVLFSVMVGPIAMVLYFIAKVQFRRPEMGLEALIGLKGVVVEDLNPEGFVKLGGELWRAKSLGSHVEKGQVVEVVKVEGLTLLVRKSGGDEG